MYSARTYSTCSVALSLDRVHDYEIDVQYANYFIIIFMEICKKNAATEIKSKKIFFFYGEEIPYSQFCKTVRFLLNKMFVFFLFFFFFTNKG